MRLDNNCTVGDFDPDGEDGDRFNPEFRGGESGLVDVWPLTARRELFQTASA